jgi:hypothetical protein
MKDKAILVIDTPSNCTECKLTYYDSARLECFCTLTSEYICHYKDNKSPHCPLSSLPEPKTFPHIAGGDIEGGVQVYRYIQGYNDFRNEILKGETE